MAANTRDIRRRIKSVKNTAQITKAMQMVAASKMRKAQQLALDGRPYAQLLNKLTAEPSRTIPDALRKNILAYYSDPNAPISTKKNPGAWQRVQTELATLRAMKAG